ncbi:hypothetical protein Tco_0182240, partial [Tanacetum coccineum]
TMGVPLIEGTGYTIYTVTIEYEWQPPRCDLSTPTVEKNNDGFEMVGKKKKKKKGTSKSTNGVLLLRKVKSPRLMLILPLDDENEKDVENVYDESANLFLNSKTGGSSSFAAAAG